MPVRRGFGWLKRVRLQRREGQLRWVADSTTVTLAAQAGATGNRFAIVSVADYDYSAGAAEPTGATLMCIRANIAISSPRVRIPVVLPNAAAECMMGISRHDVDDSGFVVGGHADPRVLSQQVNEDWLWLGMSAPDDIQVHYLTLNLKVKRKLRDSSISFHVSVSTTGAGTGDWIFLIQTRSLLKLGTRGA